MGIPIELLKRIDDLVEESSHASEKYPVTNKDWEIVVKTYELWRVFFPNLYEDFIKSAEFYRDSYVTSKGVVKEGNSVIQHKLEMPEFLYKMLKKVFPEFKLDDKTINKFVSVLPEFGVSK